MSQTVVFHTCEYRTDPQQGHVVSSHFSVGNLHSIVINDCRKPF